MTTETKKINITPDISLFPKIGQTGYTVAQALSELIDNSIDARDGTVDINIKIDKKKGYIIVEDNGCGMDEETAVNSIKLGSSKKEAGDLGQFGIGLKAACMSLGKKFTLETSSMGSDEEYILVFDEDEFVNSGSWMDFEIQIKKGFERDKSFTRIKIERLKIKFYPTFFDVLKRHLSERFAPFIVSEEVKIKVNNDEIEPEAIAIFPDSKKEFSISLSTGGRITGWTGVLKVGSVERSGFNLYRHKRLIRIHEKLGYIYHPSKMAITGEIFMDLIPVTINKREFESENPLYIEFFQKFSKYLQPILAEVQKRHQEEAIRDLPKEIKETLKDNLLRALNSTEELKELAFPGNEAKKRSKEKEGVLLEQEKRDRSDEEIATIESDSKEIRSRTPQKTSSNKVRFITIAGERYQFDYEWAPLEESIAKQAYLDKERSTIVVVLNNHYHMLKVLPKPDLFYHIVFLTEGIVEVFLRENNLSLEKVIGLRDKLTQHLADIMAEDIVIEDNEKDSQLIEARTYLLKSQETKEVLSKNERIALEQKLEQNMTYQEIANDLRVSRQRVEQLFKAALRKINKIFKPKRAEKLAQKVKLDKSKIVRENAESIIQSVAKMYNSSVDDLLGSSRRADLVLPRHTIMYLLRKELELSFSQIAKIMGKKDHSSIVYAYQKIKDAIKDRKDRDEI